jgi:hypothetical protein
MYHKFTSHHLVTSLGSSLQDVSDVLHCLGRTQVYDISDLLLD